MNEADANLWKQVIHFQRTVAWFVKEENISEVPQEKLLQLEYISDPEMQINIEDFHPEPEVHIVLE